MLVVNTLCNALQGGAPGPIHTGCDTTRKHKWNLLLRIRVFTHWTQATSKELPANFRAVQCRLGPKRCNGLAEPSQTSYLFAFVKLTLEHCRFGGVCFTGGGLAVGSIAPTVPCGLLALLLVSLADETELREAVGGIRRTDRGSRERRTRYQAQPETRTRNLSFSRTWKI